MMVLNVALTVTQLGCRRVTSIGRVMMTSLIADMRAVFN